MTLNLKMDRQRKVKTMSEKPKQSKSSFLENVQNCATQWKDLKDWSCSQDENFTLDPELHALANKRYELLYESVEVLKQMSALCRKRLEQK